MKGIKDAISIGAKHLGEHPGEVLKLIFIVISGVGGHKVHGAGDSYHLLEGVSLKNSGGVDAREVDGGCGCNRRGGGGIHGGCSRLRQIDKQLELEGRRENWGLKLSGERREIGKPWCIEENVGDPGGRHSNIFLVSTMDCKKKRRRRRKRIVGKWG